MAGKLIEVECQIIKIEDNPKGGQNIFVECKVGQRKWTKELWANYNKPISMEKFKRELKKVIWPKDDDDMLRFVKQEADQPFTIKATPDKV